MNKKRGFTLIEILVVITIIGILSAIVLTFINSARLSAKDARIKSNVKNIKTQLEIGFNGTRYVDLRSYTGSGSDKVGILFGSYKFCDKSFATSEEICKSILSLMNDSLSQGGEITYVINTTDTSWFRADTFAIYGKLASDNTQYFCLDSAGGSKQKTTKIDTATCQ